MAGMSKYLALALFNMALNPSRAAFTPPAGLWIALHTAPPSDSTYGTEATYLGYARQTIESLTATTLAETAGGDVNIKVTNGAAITFPPSTSATGQAVTNWAIWDDATVGNGNILFSGSLATPRLVSAGDSVVIPELAITLLIK